MLTHLILLLLLIKVLKYSVKIGETLPG